MKNALFLCCHNSYSIIPPLFNPIQCGAALNPCIAGVIHDNDGENISIKNREYCELTAHYYAWKNISADYYGFCHYRRLFCIDDSIKRPYLVFSQLTDERLLGTGEQWEKLISGYEIIAPRSENMGLTVREHYCGSQYHYADDLNLFIKILKKQSPHLSETVEKYLSQQRQYFCNMFIMDKAHFYEYCDILFNALNEFDLLKKPHGDFQSDRADGYLGEIFTGIYISYCYENKVLIKELPRLDICCSAKKRISDALFPPESKRRFLAKKIVKGLRRK